LRLIRGQLGGSLAAPTLVWLQQDLRLDDQPALAEACRSGEPLIPVYLWSPSEEGDWALGGAARWWLHQSLRALDGRLRERGSRLVLRRGPAIEALTRLCAEIGARRVLWNRRYEPAAIERDRRVKQQLSSAGIEAQSFNGSLLWEPWEVASGAGRPYRVFMPFWKGCLRVSPAEPQGDPRLLAAPEHWPASDELASFGLEPQVDWASGLRESWTPGELGTARRLERLRDDALDIEVFEDSRVAVTV
jgi:deoxyribodipyrimidine photo-lyase